MTNELSPEQRERLARLIESELGSLRDAALAAGATPESVSGTLRDRRRALEADEPAEPADAAEPADVAEPAEPADPDV